MAGAPSDARLYEKYAADPAVYAEVMSFAEYLGFDLFGYPDLYWIAEQVHARALPHTHTHTHIRTSVPTPSALGPPPPPPPDPPSP